MDFTKLDLSFRYKYIAYPGEFAVQAPLGFGELNPWLMQNLVILLCETKTVSCWRYLLIFSRDEMLLYLLLL